ncbi:MAG: 5-oxoprolinase subunit A [Candidatus Celerinatantimonas neptuna]|nr:MAG: 5-oxoprolinase subunit A [Candidatus Celerinatantimonas neptuna]
MQSVDFNSDMGEGFGPWTIGDDVDAQLMPLLSSANIATGFHAGDPSTMARTLELAKAHDVAVGAHPGFRDLVGFGRRHMNASHQEIINDVIYQIGAMRELACQYGLPLQHVKPHGALYMYLSKEPQLARSLVETIHQVDSALAVYCLYGSEVYKAAVEFDQPVVCEFYADREYDQSGSIVFIRRTEPLEPLQVARRVLKACQSNQVTTFDGKEITISFDSICLHSDTPGALPLARAIVEQLNAADIPIETASVSYL